MADTATTPTSEAPIFTPKPKTVTPLDPPEVFYNVKWRVPPLIIHTKEEAEALDPTEWMTNPPPDIGGPSSYPKVYYNINVAPKVVDNADEEKALSGDWREFNITEALITAAQAKIDAKK